MNKQIPRKIVGPHNIDICALIFASLLGDSYGEKRNGSTRFILQQEESNVTYLMWFHKYLATRGYCSPKKPRLKIRIGAGGKVRFFYRVRTYSFASLNWIYDAFYQNGSTKKPKASPVCPKPKGQCLDFCFNSTCNNFSNKKNKAFFKEVPKELIWTLLTPLALAVWIMDDGTPLGTFSENAGLKIATHCFQEQDIWFLCNVLNHKYNLYARPHCVKKNGVKTNGDGNQFVVYIPKSGMPQLGRLISAYIVPSMHRKLNGYYFVNS